VAAHPPSNQVPVVYAWQAVRQQVREGTHIFLSTPSDERIDMVEPKKILYIEDNKTNAMLVTKVLRNVEGVELCCAANGEEGLELARSMSPDLVLLDIGLPGMSGYDVLRYIREDTGLAGTRVVAMTASASQDDVAVGVQAGFDAYLTKPFDIRHFLRLLDKLLDLGH